MNAVHHENELVNDPAVCKGYAGQTPRDIDSKVGINPVNLDLASPSSEVNFCDIHIHANAEHKAQAFNIYAGDGKDGYGSDYQCGISKKLTKAERKTAEGEICKGLQSGDKNEIHLVHTSCDAEPGAGLGSCLSDACANLDLREATQIFTLVNDSNALSFNDLAYDGNLANRFHQAKASPNNTGTPIQFMGSTTDHSYTE
ncbi:MAG: hypothetical protein ACI9LY_001926 [Arenicella sp.]